MLLVLNVQAQKNVHLWNAFLLFKELELYPLLDCVQNTTRQRKIPLQKEQYLSSMATCIGLGGGPSAFTAGKQNFKHKDYSVEKQFSDIKD